MPSERAPHILATAHPSSVLRVTNEAQRRVAVAGVRRRPEGRRRAPGCARMGTGSRSAAWRRDALPGADHRGPGQTTRKRPRGRATLSDQWQSRAPSARWRPRRWIMCSMCALQLKPCSNAGASRDRRRAGGGRGTRSPPRRSTRRTCPSRSQGSGHPATFRVGPRGRGPSPASPGCSTSKRIDQRGGDSVTCSIAFRRKLGDAGLVDVPGEELRQQG